MINRRQALARLGGFMAAGFVGLPRAFSSTDSTATLAASPAPASGESLTIAHITDIHIYDQRDAPKWFAKCLHEIQSNAAKPSLILNTGDCVMDTLSQSRSEAEGLWKVWNDLLKGDNSIPVRHCLGNHDHWGLALPAGDPAKKDLEYGKKFGLDNLGLAKGYYSYDQGGWHFIALDSILPTGKNASPGWIGLLDDEQFEWLKADLKATPKDRPVLVYSHIPILQVAAFKSLKPDVEHNYTLSPYGMMGDARKIIDLFELHPNVKLCLSGHLHLEDRIELSGVTYICDGSVSGAWWKGNHVDSKPGYSILNLHPNGTFDYQYETYGWAGEVVQA